MRSGTGQIGGKSAFSRPLFGVHTGVFPFFAVRFGKLCGEKLIAFSRMRNQSLAIDCEYSIILIGVCRTNMYVS